VIEDALHSQLALCDAHRAEDYDGHATAVTARRPEPEPLVKDHKPDLVNLPMEIAFDKVP
jgi:hypothetical protein